MASPLCPGPSDGDGRKSSLHQRGRRLIRGNQGFIVTEEDAFKNGTEDLNMRSFIE